MATKKTTKKKTKKKAAKKKASKKTPRSRPDEAELDEIQDTVPAINLAADNLGKTLMSALVDELNDAGAWSKMSEGERRTISDRLQRRVRHEARLGFNAVLASGVPRFVANLGKVVLSADGAQGTLKIPRGFDRHDLSDFAGRDVLVVLTKNVEDHLVDIDEMMEFAIESQQQLPLDEKGGDA